jgi:hypothetical protein
VARGGVLTLSTQNGAPQFPYLYPKGTALPTTGPYTVVASIAFATTGPDGTGLDLDTTRLKNDIPESTADPTIVAAVWDDTSSLRTGFASCPAFHPGNGPTAFNVYTFEVTKKTDTELVNGIKVLTCSSAKRAKHFFIGNPVNPGGATSWSTFEVRYIRVEKGTPRS